MTNALLEVSKGVIADKAYLNHTRPIFIHITLGEVW